MSSVAQPAKVRFSYFLLIGVFGLFGALAGFMGTFFIPVAQGTFKAPFVIYVHGAFAFSWVILFVAQSVLIGFQTFRAHITLGFLGIVVAAGTAITMIP